MNFHLPLLLDCLAYTKNKVPLWSSSPDPFEPILLNIADPAEAPAQMELYSQDLNTTPFTSCQCNQQRPALILQPFEKLIFGVSSGENNISFRLHITLF